jgi:hypothetical protein
MEVKIGQIWKDNDKRTNDRQLEIIGFAEDKAVVCNIKTKKTTKVSLTRFKPNATGYLLIKDV